MMELPSANDRETDAQGSRDRDGFVWGKGEMRRDVFRWAAARRAEPTFGRPRRRSVFVVVALVGNLVLVHSPAFAQAPPELYTDRASFQSAAESVSEGFMSSFTFNELLANWTDTYENATEFGGAEYASLGIEFQSPLGLPLFIAPGGLQWNATNSLSVFRFPFDEAVGGDQDNLVVTLDRAAAAVGFQLVDNGGGDGDMVTFICEDGTSFPLSLATHGFVGVVSDCPINRVEVVEGEDSDDINYDDFLIVPACDNEFTAGDDFVLGSQGDDVLCGGDGDDVIDGLGGQDVIMGGAGHDDLSGAGGPDRLLGGAGDDFLDGGDSVDLLHGEGGQDTVEGGSGADGLFGGGGRDFLFGGQGNDYLAGDGGKDELLGGDGQDSLYGGGKADTLLGQGGEDDGAGGGGRDLLKGGAGFDILKGNAGNDTIKGQGGNDDLFGNNGNDTLNGGLGNSDTCLGGPGIDTIVKCE